jgi:prepilin-type N-terminal cleavage/methylation domain-containing protein
VHGASRVLADAGVASLIEMLVVMTLIALLLAGGSRYFSALGEAG